MIKKILNKITHTQQIMLCISITFISAMVLWSIDVNKSTKEVNSTRHYNIHTEIPRGYNLYALEVDNFNAINSLIDNFALVNLYQVYENKNSKLALKQVKLIRSPKDPRYFAVLATDEQLKILTKFPGPFKVSLQNPLSPSKQIKNKVTRKRIITIEEN